MSKVLKFIVHLVVICTLICVLGLVLPPFFGVRTVIVDKSDSATNLPVGSVTYAIPEKSSEILMHPKEQERLQISLFLETRHLQSRLEIMFRRLSLPLDMWDICWLLQKALKD